MLASCVVSKDPQRRQALLLQRGKIVDDTSWLYTLPYEPGTSHLVVQAYFGSFTHKNRAAIDFKMKKGTPIHAARGGVVIRVKKDGYKGGWNKKYRPEGNFIVVQHVDSSRAGYWHLQQNGVLVNLGDTVKQGQLVALSGKTGNAAFPHLHFLVWTNKYGGWRQVPTRFNTTRGPRYLRPFRRYKAL